MNHIPDQCRVVTQAGLVAAVHGDVADIQIVQTSACASCRIRGVCAAGDSAARIIQVPQSSDLVPGTRVELRMPERHGWLGVLFAFVLPLLLVVGATFGLAGALGGEEAAAMVGIGLLGLYYGALFLTRHIFSRIVQFEAVPLKEGIE